MSNWQPPGSLPDLRRVGVIALDCETNDEGLRAERGSSWPWRGGYICGISVAWHGESGICANYVPLRHPDSDNFERKTVIGWVKDLFASNLRIVTQNGLYDYGWIFADFGLQMPPSARLEEIGALATLVDENRFHYGLDSLCEWRGLPGKDTILLEEAAKAAGFKVNKKNPLQSYIWQLPAHLIGPYAEADAVNTLALFENLNPILDQEGTRDAYRLDVDLLPMVHAMRRRGIRVDQVAAERARDYCLQKRDRALADLSAQLAAPTRMDEIGSPIWKARTFDAHGIGYPRTIKGNPSFKAGKLGWMGTHEHWLPRLIATANKYNDAGAKFLEGHILAHLVGDRIYAEINPHRSENGGTRSFRFSYSAPPLQQMPSRDEELGPLIRSAFLPEEGETWVTADCSQQEFRFVVHHAAIRNLAGAQQAVERYCNDPDTDFHLLASEITGLPRKDAKAVNFARIYGAGIKKFAEMIGRPLAQAQAIYAQYDRLLPFISQLARTAHTEASRTGYTLLYDGARRHWDKWAPRHVFVKGAGPCPLEEAKQRTRDPEHPWFESRLGRSNIHTALNALIQGSAARHTKLWMRSCWQAGVVPLLQMHDGLECSVTTQEQGELIARLACEAVKLAVPMRADIKFGTCWGDAKYTWQARQDGHAPKIAADPIIFEAVPLAAAAESALEDEPVTMASIPFMITRAMREQLNALGVSEQAIVEMTPQQAHAQLQLELAASPEEPVMPPQQDPPAKQSNGSSYRTNGRGNDQDYPCGESEVGQQEMEFIYHDLKRAPYLKVCKRRTRDGKKSFPQYHMESGRWTLGKPTGPAIPYRLPELLEAPAGAKVWVCEGEKDAKTLAALGLVATCNPEGAGKWTAELNKWFSGFAGAYVLEDNDEAGRKHAPQVATALSGVIPDIRVLTFRELPERGDVTDWMEAGGTLAGLLARAAQAPKFAELTAEPYAFPDEEDIPAWQWLYGRHLLRGEVSGSAAMGGTGKSSLSIVEALAMTSGRALLGAPVPKPLRVVLVNLEDSRNTMDKRIAAVMRFYGLTPADIGGRLILKAKGEIQIKVAQVSRSGDVVRNRAIITALTKLMLDHKADVLSIDSFVRTHKVVENDNSAMLEVVECFEEIALGAQCAVHLWHHTRKTGAGEQITVASARGAGAIADAFRSYRMLETMSEKEHEQLIGIAPDMLPAGFYLRAFNGKRNFAPPAEHSDWFKLENVDLLNGDAIGVATSWTYPATLEDIPPEMAELIVTDIGGGMPNGRRYSNHNRATKRQAWPVVAKHCPTKTASQCRRAVTKWIEQGLLYEDEYEDPIERRMQRGLFAREAAVKGSPAEETEAAA